MTVVLVAAVARNGVVGADGGLPWSIPADLQHFKAVTVGKPIIMGRATYDSIGRPLPQRTNIVLTRNPGFTAPGTHRAADVAESLQIARREHGSETDVCVIGGGQIYSLFMPVAAVMELTRIDMAPPGDAYFPPWNDADWDQTWSEQHTGPPAFEFVRLIRLAERDSQHKRAFFDGPTGASDE